MSFNINLIPEEQKKIINAEKEQDFKLRENAEGANLKYTKSDMSIDEHHQMYNANFIDKGIPIIKISCRKCGDSKETAKSSDFYATKICAKCKRLLTHKNTTVEL